MPLKRLWFVFLVFVCAAGAQAASPSVEQLLEKSPIVFERNDGQSPAGNDFLARGVGYAFELHPSGAVMHVAGSGVEPLSMTLPGARHDASAIASEPSPGITNYYRGSQWVAGVPSFARVTYENVYDGIDVAYYGAGRTLEYDFIVSPGADPSKIAIDFAGVDAFCLEDDGTLVLTTGFGDVRHQTPYAYQERGGIREQVVAHFRLDGGRVSFEVGEYDRDRELVIDPRVVYNYNVPEAAEVRAIGVDTAGNVVVVGHGANWIALRPVGSATYADGLFGGATIVKFNPIGEIVFSTYLGGDGGEEATAVDLDGSGNVYVAGITTSTNFPVSSTAFQDHWSLGLDYAGTDVFATKLSPTGQLVYSTYLGAGDDDWPTAAGVDALGRFVIAGKTSSEAFPVTVDHRTQKQGNWDYSGFVTKLSEDGSSLVYSSLFQPWSTAEDVTVLDDGRAFVAGSALNGIPTTPGVLQSGCATFWSPDNCRDAFIAELSPTGDLTRATFLGGTGEDYAMAIAVDDGGDVLVGGYTYSTDFPVTENAFDDRLGSDDGAEEWDGFYARVDSTFSTLEYATFWGDGNSYVWDMVVDHTGRVTLATIMGGQGPLLLNWENPYAQNCYLSQFDASNTLLFSTIMDITALAVDDANQIYVGWSWPNGVQKIDTDIASHTPFVIDSFSPAHRSNFPREKFYLYYFGELDLPVTVSIGGRFPTSVSVGQNPAGEKWIVGWLPPDMDVGFHDVTVTTASGKTATVHRGFEQVEGNLSITSINRPIVSIDDRDPLVITGSGFIDSTDVVLRSSSSYSDWSLAVYRENPTTLVIPRPDPDLMVGTYDIYVRNETDDFGAEKLWSGITLTPGTGSNGVSPMAARTSGGTLVRVGVPYASVSFDGLAATPVSGYYSVPPHARGRADVSVSTPDGATIFPGFLYVEDVSIGAVSPLTGSPWGGETVTITGNGFLDGARVTFDGVLAQNVVVLNGTTIEVETPPHHPGWVTVAVINPDGGEAEAPAQFRFDGPYVDFVSSSFADSHSAPSTGGVSGSVHGSGFAAGSRVWFGKPGDPSSNVEAVVTSATSGRIAIITPPHPVGYVDVTVENPDGTRGVHVGGFTIDRPDGPTISHVSPSSGPLAGGTPITIHGTGYAPGAVVTIAGVRVRDLVITDTQITGTTPRGSTAGLQAVRVVNPDYRWVSVDAFTYTAPPAITAVSPAVGSTAGGTPLHITGSNINPGASISIGGTAVDIEIPDSSGSIWVNTPPHASGDVDVTITNPDGQSATLPNAFRYLPPAPTIASFTPDHAAPGNPVVITGTNFEFVQSVTFFNGKAAEFTVDSPTQITAFVPSQSADGPITITTQSGVGTSATNFVVDSTAPEITSFTPSAGSAGDVITITGLRFTGATAVKFGTLSAVFSLDSETQITATVPANPKTGKISVTSPQGTGTSETSFVVPPRFTSFSPSYALPGASITINGVNFEGTTEVSFNGTPATTITVNAAATAITVTVPAGATTGLVTITAQGGTVISTTAFVVPPQVDSFTPASGDPGTAVVLTGARLTGATKVTFGGVTAASFDVDSATQITAVSSPTAKSGPICVTVSTKVGCSATDYTFPPRFASSPFTPSSAIPGTSVKLNGLNFQGTTAVSFNGIAQPVFTVNATGTTITLDVPPGVTTGPVSVTTPVGTVTSTVNFGVPAEITSFDPAQGPEGTVVSLTGVRFSGATAVKFGGVAATTFAAASDTAMTATVPANAKTGTICVTTPGGAGCSLTSFSATPRITSFSPANALPGAVVEVRGTSFHGTTVVSFDGELATPFTVDAAGTKITTTVPMAARTGPVTVTTPVGTFTSTTNFGVRPAVTSFSPTEGEPDSVVTITGVRLTGATAVRFGSTGGATSPTINVISDTEVTAVVPLSGKTGIICVTTPGGQGCSEASFVMPPRVTGFSPASALPLAAVTINGLNFQDATTVVFSNGVAQATFTVNAAATSITTTVPAGAITGPVTVTTPSGTHVSTMPFKVPPAVSSFTPATGDVGTAVTIQGVRFEGATAVQFGGTSGGSSTPITVTDTTIEAVVPATGKSGTICVTTPGGKACSESVFSMPPRVTSFSLANALPGMSISVNGANFENTSAVSFNGVSASPFTVNAAATVITVTVPDGATTGPVSVTTPLGTGTSATAFGVRPEVAGFTPASGSAGDTVTITGVRLDGTTGVKFNGVAATTFANVSATSVTAVVPVTATTGTICVTTAGGSGCSASEFIAGPRITGFSPTKAPPGASISINGANFQNATAVSFSGVAQPEFTVNGTGTTITTTVPASATTGTISVTTPVGTTTSSGVLGVYATLAGFTPASGGPGTSVVITGERLADASSVRFNGVTASFTANNATTITAIVPPTATTGKISVTTFAGAVSSADTFTVGAKISGFTPNKGAAGQTITINGSSFTDATAVSFNDVPASSFVVNSASNISAVVPAGATTGPVTVTTPSGSGTSAVLFYLPAAITSFTPVSGAPGTVVTVNGVNFTDASTVRFNNVSAALTRISNTQLTATVPATATTGAIAITTPHSTVASGMSFTVLAAPAPVLQADATTITNVALAWTGDPSVQYDVQRAASYNGLFSTLMRVSGISFNDSTAIAGTTYFYRVVRVSDAVMSNSDHATTVIFIDDPLVAGVAMKAAHVTQLRSGVNAMRLAAGLAAVSWTEPARVSGSAVRLAYLTELRNALSGAMSAVGNPMTFADPSPAIGSVVKAAHFQELRNALK